MLHLHGVVLRDAQGVSVVRSVPDARTTATGASVAANEKILGGVGGTLSPFRIVLVQPQPIGNSSSP